MTSTRRVVWKEGMFLRPHHFQQQDRFWESYIEQRSGRLRPYAWGLYELELDRSLLPQGKLGVSICRGVLPDGTPFDVPGSDAPPPVIDVPTAAKEALVYLTLPVRREDGEAFADEDIADSPARYRGVEASVRDNNRGDGSTGDMLLGQARLKLRLDLDERGAYAALPLVRVREVRADKGVELDPGFIAPCIDCRAQRHLHGFIKEVRGLLRHRCEALAAMISQTGRGGTSEVADFMMLQAVNRIEPLFGHLEAMSGLHPEDFYRVALASAGELATFAARNRRSEDFPPYRHDDLEASFEPVIAALRRHLAMVIDKNAIQIPLTDYPEHHIKVGVLKDRTLLSDATFVLAANAQIAGELLRQSFPAQVKVGSVETIADLVNRQLPGIPLRPLSVAPRQLPFHTGFTYFELDRGSEMWDTLKTSKSGGFAFHIGGGFPGLELEFWAIKSV